MIPGDCSFLELLLSISNETQGDLLNTSRI